MSDTGIKETPEYQAYHRRVVDAVRKNLATRWPDAPSEQTERNVQFFNVECDYLDEFREGADPEEVASDNIDAADWS